MIEVDLTLVEVELLLREHHDGPEEGDEANLRVGSHDSGR